MGARKAVLIPRSFVGSATLAVALTSVPALAQPSPWNVSYPVDGTVAATLLGASYLLSRYPVDTTRRWQHEPFPFDDGLRGRYSESAAAWSDALGTMALATPAFAVAGGGLDESVAHRGIIYAQALSATMLLTNTSKYLVQRPRPHAYSLDPDIVAMTKSRGSDSHLSFYSGHSSIAFTGAIAGSYMFAVQSTDETGRAWLWGAELAFASMTANLRIRAGKHYYSDVIMGSLVGAAVGLTVPRIHLDSSQDFTPTGTEYAAMAGGLVGGTLLAWLLPLPEPESAGVSLHVSPMPSGHGLSLIGQF